MSTSRNLRQFAVLAESLLADRRAHVEEVQRIDAVFQRLSVQPPDNHGAGGASGARRGRPAAGRRPGRKPGGQRVQGVKQALLDSLTDTPQTPAQLKAKVCGKVGANVNITTQLAMLKREKLAKPASRGLWIRA